MEQTPAAKDINHDRFLWRRRSSQAKPETTYCGSRASHLTGMQQKCQGQSRRQPGQELYFDILFATGAVKFHIIFIGCISVSEGNEV